MKEPNHGTTLTRATISGRMRTGIGEYWIALVLMLVAILVYVMTDSLSLRPGKHAVQSTPGKCALGCVWSN